MNSIILPFKQRDFKYKKEHLQDYIWDVCRKKYVLLTPEEYVRQHIIAVLVEDYEYPKGLIAVEKQIKVEGMKKRYDIVVFKENMQPFMLIECKAPEVSLDENVLYQILNYLQEVQSKYIMISNGKLSFVASMGNQTLNWQTQMPKYNI